MIRHSDGLNVVRGGQNTFLLKNNERRAGNEVDFTMNLWAGFRCASDVPDPVAPPSDQSWLPTPPAATAVGEPTAVMMRGFLR